MPNKRAEELRSMDVGELEGRLAEAKQELFNLRFQVVTGQLDNNARISQVKRDVARMNTVLREREIAEAEAKAEAATERLAMPTVMMMAGFVVLIGFPALYAVITGV